MAASDQLIRLVARADVLEDLAVAARQKAKNDLEHDVKRARHSAQAHAEWLRKIADARKGRISAAWGNLERSWARNIAAMHNAVDDRAAERDVRAARRKADQAEDDAAFAIDYAYAAIAAAEHAVLDAELACMELGDLAANTPRTALDEEVA